MWTINDVWKVWDFLKSGTNFSSQVDGNLSTIAKSEKDRTTTFFENVLDQYCFLSPDYDRLKNMWIDWYSTFKSFSVSQKETSDPFSLTEANLVELMKSFGYSYYVEALSFNTKVNFFLDLVNLYKVKGTPFALDRVLAYFGLSDMELVEYDLEKSGDHDVIFVPKKSIPDYIPPITVNVPPILFNDMIFDDPHWMMTKQQILDGYDANTINLPSRSPYFGINAYFNMGVLAKCISILVRKVQDDYQSWLSTGLTNEEVELKKILGGQYRAESLAEEIKLKKISGYISILELYVGTCYLFNNVYGSATGTGPWFLSYNLNVPDPTNYGGIETLWNSLLVRPTDRFDRDLKLYQFQNSFHRAMSNNFIHTAVDVGLRLQQINPVLKVEIDSWIASSAGEVLLAYFLNELTNWIQNNIDPEMPNLMIVMLGIGQFSDLYKVINFFKPYRARLHRLSFIEYFKDKLADSVITSDRFFEDIIETFIDWDTADSWPGYLENWPGPNDVPVTSNPPLGEYRIHNLYVTPAGVTKAVYSDSTSLYSNTIVSQPPIGNHRVTNIYLGDVTGGDGKQLYVEYNDLPEIAITPATVVISNPTADYYVIREMHISPILTVSITYEYPARTFPIDSTARVYYTRNTYDAGSFFDIGVSTDWSVDDPNGMHTEIYQYIYDIYNAHPPDTTSYPSWEIVHDSTAILVETILNGNFEIAGTGGIDIFESWGESIAGPGTITKDTAVFHSLTSSCRMDMGNAGGITLDQWINLSPGKEYSLSFWHKTSVGNDLSSRAILTTPGGTMCLRNDGTWSAGFYDRLWMQQGNNIWTYFSLDFICPIGYGTLFQFYILTDDLNKSVWFDKVSIQELIMSGSGILMNGDFELAGAGGADIFSNWEEGLTANIVINGGFDVNVDDWAPGGNSAIASVVGGQVGNCCQLTRIGGIYQTFVQSFAVIPGHNYRVTYAVKSGTSGNENARLYIDDSDGTVFGYHDNTTTNAWQNFTLDFTALTNNANIWLAKVSTTPGTMLFDTVECKAIGVSDVAGYSSSHAARLDTGSPAADSVMGQQLTLTANRTYSLSFRYRKLDPSVDAIIYFYLFGPDDTYDFATMTWGGGSGEYVIGNSTSWTEVTMLIKTHATRTTNYVFGFKTLASSGDNKYIEVDDIIIREMVDVVYTRTIPRGFIDTDSANTGWGMIIDATSADSTATIMYTYGGFTDFDEGWLFDSPFNNDVCMITIVDD